MKFSKIIIATDFSECAENALEYGLELARLIKADVHIIHAVIPTGFVDDSGFYVHEHIDMRKNVMNEWLTKVKTKNSDISIDSECSLGFLTDMIDDYLLENKNSIVLMGTTGASGFLGFLGSNASAVSSKVKVPTLLIPLGVKIKENPAVALAFDFTVTHSSSSISPIVSLMEVFKSKSLEIVNVLEPNSEKPKDTSQISNLLQPVNPNFNFIEDEDKTYAINYFCMRSEIDILCVIKHERSFLHRLFNKSRSTDIVKKPITAIFVTHE
jgi:nucleotide-binding universal stress UspA family protein